jgi:hypothetical protein
VITALSSKFISINLKNKKAYKVEGIENYSFRMDKMMIMESAMLITVLYGLEVIQGFTSYPVNLFSGDVNAMFTANAQTLVAYINRAISISNFGLASAASVMTLVFATIPASIVGTGYYFVRRKYA